MRRIHLFLLLTLVSLASLVPVSVTGYYVLTSSTSNSQYGSDWMGQMGQGMGGIIGGNHAHATAQNSASPHFGVAFIASIAAAIPGI
jgi:hypothetical protein